MLWDDAKITETIVESVSFAHDEHEHTLVIRSVDVGVLLTQMRDEYEAELAKLRAAPALVRVPDGEYACMCTSCRNKEPDCWHWNWYVNLEKIGVVQTDDNACFHEATLPPGVALYMPAGTVLETVGDEDE